MSITIIRIDPRVLKLKLDNSDLIIMSPSEFCRLYVQDNPDNWGYRKKCIDLLSSICGVTPYAVEKWWDKNTSSFDNCPETINILLKREHQVRQMRSLLNDDNY